MLLLCPLLNLFPGIGVGYIYQRRWRPYFLTLGAVAVWFVLGIFLQKNDSPNQTEQIIGLSGLALISLITSIESNLAHKKSFEAITEISTRNLIMVKGMIVFEGSSSELLSDADRLKTLLGV